jgi:hypothetical protein
MLALASVIAVIIWTLPQEAPVESVRPVEAQSPPVLGGMAMPTPTVAIEIPTVFVPSLTAIAPGSDGWQDGQVVAARNGPLVLYADARTSSAMLDAYPTGTVFVVLEPSGDYAIYPVKQEGKEWVRLRATDGLVGWATTDKLEQLR